MANMYGRGSKAKATKLHSQIVRSLGYCEACDYHCKCEDKWKHGQSCKLQAAHIEGRKASGTRTQLRNAFCLCASCHRKFTDKPLAFSRFVTTTWAQKFREDLLELSRPMSKGQKFDWDEELVRLEAIVEDIQEGELTLAEARDMEALE